MKRLLAYFIAISLVFLPIMGLAAAVSPRWVLPLMIVIVGWFIWGAKIIGQREWDAPQPAVDRIDVVAALRVLWWAAWWPRYL
ncbi:MAG: hypothetical protein H6970_14080 [Gammaproteobacteria bacterium]|nr:hypothetical protein [Gammaproteobacteria bacterium]